MQWGSVWKEFLHLSLKSVSDWSARLLLSASSIFNLFLHLAESATLPSAMEIDVK